MTPRQRAMPQSLSLTPESSHRLARVRQKDTGAEMALRRAMHRNGLRYRVDYEVLKKPRRVADIAFPGRRIAIFVDGCFWHGCPEHASWPKRNADFWRQKIEANRRRDIDTNERLKDLGWTVLRFWSHEPPDAAAHVVMQAIAAADSRRLSTTESGRRGVSKREDQCISA